MQEVKSLLVNKQKANGTGKGGNEGNKCYSERLINWRCEGKIRNAQMLSEEE